MKATQNSQILKYLKIHKKGITQREALNEFGCQRLASRICDLRQLGYAIEREMIAVKNRDDEVCYVARYTLVE